MNPRLPSDSEQQPAQGMLILTTAHELQYMNDRAAGMIRQLHESNGAAAADQLPIEITSLCRDIRDNMYRQPLGKGPVGPLLACMVEGVSGPVMLRGLGFPVPDDLARSRILVLIEELGHETGERCHDPLSDYVGVTN